MEKVIFMKKNTLVITGIAASLALLVACSDEVTEVTNVSEMVSLDTVKKFKELPKCEEETEGSVMYVKDSAKVYVCTGDGWTRMNGKDGEKGDKGDKGANGAAGDDGASCTAKQTKDKTGFDIVCDGKTVGTVKNGEDGKGGDKGDKGPDGTSGTSCSAKANKDKTGFDILCGGKTVGTIKNGEDGEDGDDCTLTEGENGQIIVKCGEESVTLFKASCGVATYDPATQFCSNDKKVYPLCHKALGGLEPYLNPDGTYNVQGYFCDSSDLLVSLCVTSPYDYTTQFCSNRSIYSRCSSIAEGLAENVLKEDGSYDGMIYFCSEKGVLYEKCAGSPYDPDLQFCDKSEENPQVVAKCGGQTYEIKTQWCVNGQIESSIACCVKEGQNDKWCEGHPNSLYDIRNQFCDTRDGQPYKFTEITVKGDSGKVIYSETWMAQNLNYAGTGADESACIDCETIGRFYTWPAAMSYCPDGWRLPTMAEFAALNNAVDDGQRMLKLKVNYGWSPAGTDEYGFSLMQSSYMMDVSQTEVKSDGMKAALFWTSSPRTEQQISRDDAHYVIYNNESYSDNANSVDIGFPVRCIKDKN